MEQSKRLYLLSAAMGLILLIGIIDYATGIEISVSIFYLLPIAIITLKCKKRDGVIASILSAFIWFFADLAARSFAANYFVLLWNTAVRFGFFIGTVLILSRLNKSLEAEKELARKDFLTDIANTKAFYEAAHMELERAKRYKRSFAAAYLDCDDFKAINDSYGHKSGDDLLRCLAKLIQNNVRTLDTVARLGGDEFIILLPETGYEAAKNMFSRLNNVISGAFGENGWNTTLSIGVAVFDTPPQSVDDMIKRADGLMYSAKKRGKNTVEYAVFHSEKEKCDFS